MSSCMSETILFTFAMWLQNVIIKFVSYSHVQFNVWAVKGWYLWNLMFIIFDEMYQNILILITIGEKLRKFYENSTQRFFWLYQLRPVFYLNISA